MSETTTLPVQDLVSLKPKTNKFTLTAGSEHKKDLNDRFEKGESFFFEVEGYPFKVFVTRIRKKFRSKCLDFKAFFKNPDEALTLDKEPTYSAVYNPENGYAHFELIK